MTTALILILTVIAFAAFADWLKRMHRKVDKRPEEWNERYISKKK